MKNKKLDKKTSTEKLEKEKILNRKSGVVDEIVIDIQQKDKEKTKKTKGIHEENKKNENTNKEKTEKKSIVEEEKKKKGTEEEKKQESNIDSEQCEFEPNGKMKMKSKKKNKNKKKNIILRCILVILIFVIGFLGFNFVKRMNENGWTMGGFVATMLGHDSSTLAKLPRVNILLIGQSQNLTDTLLVCSYDPKTQDAAMLSIPRDTFVGRSKNNASAFDKINAIYQINPEKLVEKAREITGLDIKYYVKVDTKGLRELVDSVGGIDFYVPIDMKYDDSTQDLHIDLKQGYQHLDGNKAEQVLRFRHNNDGSTYPLEYGEQDLGRMKTQRAFLTEVIKQLAKPESITRIDDYVKIANNNVSTSEGFSLWTLKDYAPYLIDFKTENLKTGTLPGTTAKLNELWFYIYNKKETEKLVEELFKTGTTVEQQENSNIKVNILNGTKDEANLEKLKSLLKESGYTIESTGATSFTRTTTIINRTNQTDNVSNKLQETIGVGIVANSTSENRSAVDFTIIIGDDYE